MYIYIFYFLTKYTHTYTNANVSQNSNYPAVCGACDIFLFFLIVIFLFKCWS